MEDEIKEISLSELLDTVLTINENGEMVGYFTLKRINMIANILTNLQNGFKSTVEELCETTEKLEILQEENERLTQGVTLLTNKLIDMTKEIEKLKNIIEELEKYLETEINFQKIIDRHHELRKVLIKLTELKEDVK